MHDPENLEPTRPAGDRRAARPDSLPEPLRELIGRQLAGCTIDRVLGRGSMGAVFRGIEHALGGRHVAIKVLLPSYAEQAEYLDRFQREAAAAAGLDSDHVVKIYRHGRQTRFPYLVMELVEGGTLLQQAGGKCPPATEVVRQLGQACEGLLAAERKGLVHRDIKPANIMLARRQVGRGAQAERVDVKIVDFGVARPAANLSSTQPGTFIGSPLYASPEQWEAAGEVSHVSDMYSLGATFYQLLTGKPAPPGRSEREVRAFTLQQPYLSPRDANPEVPVELDAVIRKLTARDPAERYASFADAIAALHAIDLAERSEPPARNRWPALVGVALLVAAASAVAANSWLLRSPEVNGDRDSVVQMIGLARPNGALSLRQAELADVLRAVPEPLAATPEAEAVRARAAVVEARVVQLRDLDQRGVPRQNGVDWSAVLAALKMPRGEAAASEIDAERADVARLREAIVAHQALRRDLSEVDAAIAAVQERIGRPDADLAALQGDVERLTVRCGERPSHAARAQTLVQLREQLRAEQLCMEQIATCARAVELAQELLPTSNGAALQRQLDKWPPLPDAGGAPSRAALEALAQKHAEVERALREAVSLARGWQTALDPEAGLLDLISKACAAWPKPSEALVKAWCHLQAGRCADEFVALVLVKLEAGAPHGHDAADWRAKVVQALETQDCVAIIANSSLRQRLDSDIKLARPAPPSRDEPRRLPIPIQLPADFPPDWPKERGDPAFYKRLKVAQRGGHPVFRYRADEGDAVDMVLVQQPPDDPFLIDVEPVNYERLLRSGLFNDPCGGGYQQFLTNSGATDLQRQGALVVAITPECAERYATWAGKQLPTLAQWRAVERWLGPRAPQRMAELNLELHSRTPRLPRAFGWPGAVSDSPVFSIGVRDLVRATADRYEAVGHSLFSPKDRVMTPLEGEAAVAHYHAEPPREPVAAAYIATHVGFRCVLLLPPVR